MHNCTYMQHTLKYNSISVVFSTFYFSILVSRSDFKYFQTGSYYYNYMYVCVNMNTYT